MILIYIDNTPELSKSAFELVTYGKKVADVTGTQCAALILGTQADASVLQEYGADKIWHASNGTLDTFDGQVHANIISEVAKANNCDTIIMGHGARGHATAGRVAVRLGADIVTGANALPTKVADHLEVTRNIFSGKAIATMKMPGKTRVISVMGNSIKPESNPTGAEVEELAMEIPEAKIKILSVDKQTSDRAPLPEAELVVSAGRGMKGPENWGIIEHLADALGATTACSRPVADTGWRPHHEHVGQTGVAIRPNLYIAIGISGAIQHLAGVSSSKCIVVINKDPEAPFFKAADYGVCADLFDVVPKLTDALNGR